MKYSKRGPKRQERALQGHFSEHEQKRSLKSLQGSLARVIDGSITSVKLSRLTMAYRLVNDRIRRNQTNQLMKEALLPNFSRAELIQYNAKRITQTMQAKHLQHLQMLCLVPSNGLNK